MERFNFLTNDALVQEIENFQPNELEKIIPEILHMIWVGKNEMPFYVMEYYKSWKHFMPKWEIHLWTNQDITLEHFSQHVIDILHQVEKGAQKADIMRYFIIEKYGGFYVDTDVTPHFPLDILCHLGNLILCHDLNISWAYIAIGFFGSIPHHPVLQFCCEQIETQKISLNTIDIHMHTGPRLFGEALFTIHPENEQCYIVLPQKSFYHNATDKHLIRFGTHFYSKCW